MPKSMHPRVAIKEAFGVFSTYTSLMLTLSFTWSWVFNYVRTVFTLVGTVSYLLWAWARLRPFIPLAVLFGLWVVVINAD